MKRLAAVLMFAALSFGSAEAGSKAPRFSFMDVLKSTRGTITVPPEWDGIWEVQDSTFDCPDSFTDAFADTDTICGGQTYGQPPAGSPVTSTCAGTADATSYHVTCTGNGNLGPNCLLTVVTQLDGTRTGETYHAVSTTTTTFTGTDPPCSFVQSSCTKVVEDGRRLSPAPPAYCETPVLPSSWGKIKVMYR